MTIAYGSGVRQSKDHTIMITNARDPLDDLPDAVAAAAFRRLVRHLRHRHDAAIASPTGSARRGSKATSWPRAS